MNIELEIGNGDKTDISASAIVPLSMLLRNCILAEDYKPQSTLHNHVVFTQYGEKWRKILIKEFRDISLDEICFAFIIVCFHKDILIDTKQTNLDKVFEVLGADITSRKIIYPWIFGMDLYAKFGDDFEEPLEKLNYIETSAFLENTPEGLFQINNIIVGPFGFLHSEENRMLSPVLSAPLWYCSDPTCNSLHTVRFTTGNCVAWNAVNFLLEHMNYYEGAPNDSLLDNVESSREIIEWHADFHLEDIIYLLGNAFHESELRLVLKDLFNTNSKAIREKLPQYGQYKDKWKVSNEALVDSLSKNQCLQLILLMSDKEIAKSIERLIEKRIINIPFTEVRNSTPRRELFGWLKMSCECSYLGIRTVSTTHKESLAFSRLRNLIDLIYSEEHTKLEWKLRHLKGNGIKEKLNKYLIEKEPGVVVKELILDSKERIDQCFEYLKYGYFYYPENELEDEKIIKKILWKLGLNQESYPLTQAIFWDRYKKFRNTAVTIISRDEDDKEEIRSESVNFFVSLEEILENSLSFITWMLFSDHFLKTRFSYNIDDGLKSMVQLLNGKQFGNNETLSLDEKGKNTLFPLIVGFGVLANLCEELVGEREKYKRPIEELPHYCNSNFSTMIDFPFKHQLFFLDLSVSEVNKIIPTLRQVTRELEVNQICNIRNRVKHKQNRNHFPSVEELTSCCDAIQKIILLLEEQGLYPSVFNFKGIISDQYYRNKIKYTDYKGAELKIVNSAQFTPFGMPEYQQVLLIVPSIKIGTTTESLRFKLVESSSYQLMWNGHPKQY